MRFLIVSHVVHKKVGDKFFAYGPYVKEMNLWFRHVDEVIVLAPCIDDESPDPIDLPYIHSNLKIVEVPEINTLSWPARLKLLIQLPIAFFKTFVEMGRADHIHLRCPGNIGLIGSFVQVFFPWKNKSAKYAGNWDPNSAQPLTYKWQRNILANQFWTRNMRVLVYGDWNRNNRNLLSFFTASYSESEIVESPVRSLSFPLQLIYVGSLHSGKNPMISCETAKHLTQGGVKCQLHLYGEGTERTRIQEFIHDNKLKSVIVLHGNVGAQELKKAFCQSHFLLFASETEGWPKAVAEAMFWGCLPLTTPVSCVPEMIGDGSRGDLVKKDAKDLAARIEFYLQNQHMYGQKAQSAMEWSRRFTLEKFEAEIQKVLLN